MDHMPDSSYNSRTRRSSHSSASTISERSHRSSSRFSEHPESDTDQTAAAASKGHNEQRSLPKERKKAKNQKDTWCVTVWITIILIILFSVGAFVGGYMLKQSQDSSLAPSPNISWKTLPCIFSTINECQGNNRGHVLLISLGAFPPSLLTDQLTPTLMKIKSCGTYSASLRPVFPTISITNQYSIATGLYAESHGVVDDYFRDNEIIVDAANNMQNPSWWKGEPIWVTAKKRGFKVKVAGWKGGDMAKDGILPDDYIKGRQSVSLEERLRKILEWISESSPNLVVIHFDDLSETLRSNALSSPAVERVLKDIDGALDRLFQQLHERKTLSCTDIVIVSDHGMMEPRNCASGNIMSVLNRKILNETVWEQDIVYFGETYGRLSMLNRSRLSLQRVIEALSCNHSSMSDERMPYYLMQRTEMFPVRLHYANSPRIENLLFLITPDRILTKTSQSGICQSKKNLYGYDNMFSQMHGLFFAYGPSFHSGMTLKGFSVTEIYNLLCTILKAVPAPNNGTDRLALALLKYPVSPGDSTGQPDRWSYHRADFPMTREVLLQRQDRTCSTNCYFAAEVDVLAADLQLNISSSAGSLIMAAAGFYGLPIPNNINVRNSFRLLINREFVIGFNVALKLPLWTSCFLQTDKMTPDSTVDCTRNDVRLERGEFILCRDFDNFAQFQSSRLMPAYLVPPALNDDIAVGADGRMISNIVPMYQNFRTSIWQPFWEMARGWIARNGPIHVYSGPVFDHKIPLGTADEQEQILFSQELPNVHLPSHYFVIVTRKVWDNSSVVLDATEDECMAFVFPHLPDTSQHPCQDKESYFLTYSASVKDVEQLTGLTFFSALSHRKAVHLRTAQPSKLFHK
ncbi:ectonucleotide pyrophosphatase/phosphodiesterase family member 1-like isoform X2 [Paramacrobiotus metropolitanus]|uniref:ectonucleotide pyrophosphatase/phosphodiesterase family member 1-like isoform X2 n=1 Tax=Paramacrobiotus metropolitanus TaxID=2943436 RepID=UPI002445632A|nr:ectonucleotide pyrophosphatase/phosphodiesterase family member 1-like isoform X2 [Paramacrobiotus metropolitanus]